MNRGKILVQTFKEGLLSPLAHDLELRLGRFEVDRDAQRVRARFWPETLEVAGVMRDGRLDAQALTAAQRAEIVDNIRTKILNTDQHPEIVFEGEASPSASGHRLSGQLSVLGRRVDLELTLEERDGCYLGSVTLTPTKWGIKPFKAMLGTIKLQDRVVVRFEIEKD